MTRVFKFGGALLKDAEGIERMAAIVEEYQCEPLVVVVSAIGKTTNALENLISIKVNNSNELASVFFKLKSSHLNLIHSLSITNKEKLIGEVEEIFATLWNTLNKYFQNYYYAYDQIVSFGEKISAKIISFTLTQKNLINKEVAAPMIIATDGNFTDATLNRLQTEKNINDIIIPILKEGKIVVTEGFLGGDPDGNITTLGREGSDYTAAIFGSILSADEIIFWKDVPGIMNADPNEFKDAIKLNNLSYHEAIELTFYGASVIHPKTIQPLQQKNVPLQVRSFFKPYLSPTIISNSTPNDDKIPKIILKKSQTLLSISSRNMDFISENSLYQIFKLFNKYKIHINLMQNSAISFSVCFNYDTKKQNALINDISEHYFVKYNSGLTLLTLRHYDEELLQHYTSKKTVVLEQKNRTTAQILYY